MEIFIAICEDRHIDIDVKVFSAEEKAIEYCKEFIPERYSMEIQLLTEEMKHAGWIFFAVYGVEGDNVRVERGFIL